MNVVVQPSNAGLALAPGESLVLQEPDVGYRVERGEVELYACLMQDGRPMSRRLFLFGLRAGDIVAPSFSSSAAVTVTLVAAEAVSLLPISTAVLAQNALMPDGAPGVAAAMERWLSGLGAVLAPLVGTMPSETVSVAAGTKFETAADSDIVGRGSACGWIASQDADLAYPDGQALPRIDGLQGAPLLPGVWLHCGAGATAYVLPTAAALQQAIWPGMLRSQHDYILTRLEAKLDADQGAALDLSYQRFERTELALDRTMGRFAGVLDHAPAWTGAAAAHEQWLGPFTLVCDVLGIDLSRLQREAIAKATSMEDATRSARLRQRQIALRGAWWRDDFGPFIGIIDEERRPCAVLPAGAGRMRLVDPGGGPDVIVDAKIAARLLPLAHTIYRPFAARPLKLKDLIGLGWKQSAGDIAVAVVSAFAMSLLGLATPLAMRLAFDRFIPSHETVPLVELAVGLALAALIAMGFRLAFDMASLRVDGRMAGATQAAMVDRVLRLPASALRYGAADLAQRVSAADGVRRTIVNFGLSSIAGLFALIMNGILLISYAPLGALVAWSCFGLLLSTAWLTAARQADALRRGEELQSNVNTIIFHFIKGIGVLRAAGAEDRAFARWGRDFAEMRARAYRSQAVATGFETGLAGFDVLSMAGVFLVLSMIPSHDLSIGSFMSFVASYGIFMGSAMQLSRGLMALLNTRSSWDRAAPLLRSLPESNLAKRDPGVLTGAVDVTNAVFKYGPDLPYVLSGLSLKIRAGEFVALVGVSGSGKSTIMQMLLGNRTPLAGTVQYDDMDLSHLDMELVRRQIGIVLQNGRLLPGSIFENIMGAHHGTLDDAWEAARQAGLDGEIKALPMGMHTILTEATAAFSGGQVQRIMLARALVGRPRILLLDEATSALDNTTQAIVTASLAKLAVTRVVIAHRTVTVKQADRICVIDGGRIVQSGSYDELMAGQGLFTELAQRQLL